MRRLLATLLSLPILVWASSDLKDTAALDRACRELPSSAQQLQNDDQRQRFVICHDLDLIRYIGKNVSEQISKGDQQYAHLSHKKAFDAAKQDFRKHLNYVLQELRTQTSVLQSIHLQPGEGIWIQPGRWQIDVTGDQKLETWERYLLAIPNRGHQTPELTFPSNDEDYYQATHNLDARIHVDQSDVLWALSYHQVAQALVEAVLAFDFHDVKPFERGIELKDPQRLLQAYQLFHDHTKTTVALQASLLAETDDDAEWIPSPNQKHTVFPLPMDQQIFQSWQAIQVLSTKLLSGEVLLPLNSKVMSHDKNMWLCPPNQGLNLAEAVRTIGRYPFANVGKSTGKARYSRACKPHGGDKRLIADFTEAAKNIAEVLSHDQDIPDGAYLRYLYWLG